MASKSNYYLESAYNLHAGMHVTILLASKFFIHLHDEKSHYRLLTAGVLKHYHHFM